MRRYMHRGCLGILAAGFCLFGFAARSEEAPADKEALRYNGKPFEYWRNYLRTELKAERRIDAIRALAAFGARGHAQSAATAIIEAIKDYGADAYRGVEGHPNPDRILLRTAVEAIVKIGPAGFEIVLRNIKNASVRRFAKEVYNHPFEDKSVNVLSPDAVRTLFDSMSGEDIETRKVAVELLGDGIYHYPPSKKNAVAVLREKKDTAPLVDALIELMEHENSWEMKHVLAILGPRAKRAAAALVKAGLRGDGIDEETFKAIGAEAKEMLPGITEGLKSQDARVRTRAADWLGRIGREAKSAAPALLQAIRDFPKPARDSANYTYPVGSSSIGEYDKAREYERARAATITSLALIGAEPQQVAPVLAAIVSNDEETRSCRVAAANGLMRFGSSAKVTVPVLLKTFANDAEPDEVRLSALDALEHIGADSAQVVPLLIEEIKRFVKDYPNVDWIVRDVSARSMVYLVKLRPQDKESMSLLIRAFKHPDDHNGKIRPLIAQALGEMGPSARDALPALREAAKIRNAVLRKAITAAIAKIESKKQK